MDNNLKDLADIRVDSRGINEVALNKLIVDIVDYHDKIKTILNQISDLVLQTQSYYDCDAAKEFRNKFAKLQTNFPIALENIMSYTDELMAAKNNFNLINEDMSELLNRGSNQVLDQKMVKYQEER